MFYKQWIISRNEQTFEKDAKAVGKIIYVKDADDLSSSLFGPLLLYLQKHSLNGFSHHLLQPIR